MHAYIPARDREHVQAILFSHSHWNADDARRWMKDHLRIRVTPSVVYKPIKRVHKTAIYLRYRIQDPSQFNSYKTVSTSYAGRDIEFILGYRDREDPRAWIRGRGMMV